MNKNKIGIIGAGMIGSTFATLFAQADYSIMISSRNHDSSRQLAEAKNIEAGTNDAVCDWADIILLAIPFKAIDEIAYRHASQLLGKVIIDATNPFPARDGKLAQDVLNDPADSGSEYTQRQFTDALVVKAFNATHFRTFQAKAFSNGENALAVPIAGNDQGAKRMVGTLATDIGMTCFDFGDLHAGKNFEPGTQLFNANLTIKAAKEEWTQLIKNQTVIQ